MNTKVKFTKAAYGHTANEIVEIPQDEATLFIAKGVAEAVKEVVEESSLVGEMADAIVADATVKIEAKIAEAFKKESAKLKGSKRPNISVGPDLRENDPRGGFRNMGEFAKAIHSGSVKGQYDDRLNIIAKGGMSEAVSADGGFAVPVEYATQIMQIINSEESLLPMTKNIPTTTNQLDLPIDSLVNIGTNAVSGAWISSDGSSLTEKGAGILGQLTFKLAKYGTLVGVTDELLTDNNVALESFLVQKAGYDITYNVNDAIVRGNGSGKPTGILNSAARVTVVANAADEYVSGLGITFTDIRNMIARFIKTYNGSWSNVVWLINPLVVADLYDLKDDAGRNLYYAPGTLSNSPYANLMGIRVLPSFHCSARGAEGDIILADMNAYVTLTKSTGVEAATSIHLWFDKDKTAFRFTYRIDGKPGLSAALVSPDGSGKTFSPFVTLGNRT